MGPENRKGNTMKERLKQWIPADMNPFRNRKGILLRLGTYLMEHKLGLCLAILCSVAGNVLALVGPMLSGYAIDAIEPGAGKVNFQQVGHYCLLMVLCYAISAVLTYGQSVLMLRVTKKVVFKMRNDVFHHLLDLRVGYFDQNKAGDIISIISYDIDTVNASLSSDVVQVVSSVITVIGALIMMLLISPVLVLVFVITVPISVIAIRRLTKITRPLFRSRSKELGRLNGFVEEMMGGQKTLKAYCQQENSIHKFQERNTAAIDAYFQADWMGSVVGPMVNFINNGSIALVTMFGAILYLFGKLTLGNISSFALYARKFSGPINESANILSELQSSLAAAERVFRLMDEPPEAADKENARILKKVYGDVEFQNVSFGYTKDKEIIHNLSLEAYRGKMIAIVGPTGAGKTTIINLLMRFYNPDRGTISLDGKSVADYTRESLRGAYAMVLQDTWLFHGTVYENIAYGNTSATYEQVIAAAKAARIHEYIMSLPEGYETILSDDGTNLSKGQKQLLTIARAMLLDARMLILDEATSNVDTRTERQVQEAMYTLMKDKTCFVIAHRLSTIRSADLILVIRDGDVAEQGTHESLIEAGGFYRMLYDSQFQ